MNQLQMLKKAMIAYVNSVKFIWSAIAYPLSIIGSKTTKVKGYKIVGNSVQDGTPTTENPIEVQSVGELTTKNLWTGANTLVSSGSGVATSLKTTLYASSNWWLNEVKAFTVSCTGVISENDTRTDPRLSVQLQYADGTVGTSYQFYYRGRGQGYRASVTVPEPAKKVQSLIIRFLDYSNNTGDVWDAYVKDIQIELGDTATEFEPYNKYRIPVTVRGKNLWRGSNYIVSDSQNGTAVQRLHASENEWVKSGTTVTISATVYVNDDITNTRMSVGTVCTDGTVLDSKRADFSARGEEVRISLKYTVPQTEKAISRVEIRFLDYSNITLPRDAYVKDIQIELGSTATEFEPYIKPQTTNIYLDDPLRKVGAYKDYIDFDKGVVVRNIGKQIFKGSENWEYDGSTNKNSFQLQIYNANLKTNLVSNYSVGAMSDRLIGRMWETLWQNYYKPAGATDLTTGVAVSYNPGDKRIYLKASPFSTLPTLSEWKAYLAQWSEEGNPFEMYYVIPSEEESVTLPRLPQFKGTTIYETDTTVPPSGIQVEYC